MKKAIEVMSFLVLFMVCVAVPNVFAYDMGMQSSLRMSPVSIEQGLIGLKMDMASFSITPRLGFGLADPEGDGDTLFIMTIGSGFDYYFSDDKLKPYVGGDVFLDFVDAEDSDLSVTINPHLGAEYWLSDKFSVGGNIGLQLGVGDFLGSEVRFGTTSMIHVTYYF